MINKIKKRNGKEKQKKKHIHVLIIIFHVFLIFTNILQLGINKQFFIVLASIILQFYTTFTLSNDFNVVLINKFNSNTKTFVQL